jgi:hypothetical protein
MVRRGTPCGCRGPRGRRAPLAPFITTSYITPTRTALGAVHEVRLAAAGVHVAAAHRSHALDALRLVVALVLSLVLRIERGGVRRRGRLPLDVEDAGVVVLLRCSDEKVANRDIRVWHGATETGP